MGAQIISGRDIADEIRAELKDRVAHLKEGSGVTPGLATVLVGENPASQMYVGMKNKAAADMGINSRQLTLSAASRPKSDEWRPTQETFSHLLHLQV